MRKIYKLIVALCVVAVCFFGNQFLHLFPDEFVPILSLFLIIFLLYVLKDR